VNYLDIPGMVRGQREWLLAQVRARGHSHVVHPGLTFEGCPPARDAGAASTSAASAAGAAASVSGSGSNAMQEDEGPAAAAGQPQAQSQAALTPVPGVGYLPLVDRIPGILEAGWGASTAAMLQLQRDHGALQARLRDLTDKLIAHDDSWPFREPVDVGLVPEYAAVVKEPVGASAPSPLPLYECIVGAVGAICAGCPVARACAHFNP
jgi:hypothetical protein